MKTAMIVLLFVVSCAHATLIEWPFYNPDSSTDKTFFNFTIGTPAQQVQVALYETKTCPGMTVKKSSSVAEGFEPKKSSTFRKTGDYHARFLKRKDGVTATEKFAIESSSGKIEVLKEMPFAVTDFHVTCGSVTNKATFSLTYSTPDHPNSFLDKLLEGKHKTAVVVYEVVPTIFKPNSGKLYFGGEPSVCDKKWYTISEFKDSQEQWQLEMKKFSTGSGVNIIYPGKARFALHAARFGMPSKVYKQVVSELGVVNGYLPCNTTKQISFKFEHLEVRANINDYSEKVVDKCLFHGFDNYDTDFEIPSRILGRSCLKYDFENKQVGLSKRTDQKH